MCSHKASVYVQDGSANNFHTSTPSKKLTQNQQIVMGVWIEEKLNVLTVTQETQQEDAALVEKQPSVAPSPFHTDQRQTPKLFQHQLKLDLIG